MADLRSEVEANLVWHWGNVRDELQFSTHFPIIGHSPTSCNSILKCLVAKWYHNRQCTDAVSGQFYDPFDSLVYGQRQNPPVQQMYRQLYADIGQEDFWMLVVTASDRGAVERDSEWTNAIGGLQWQKRHNAASMAEAIYKWQNEEGRSDKIRKVAAMSYLLDGQRHNPTQVAIYRECAKENIDRLFDRAINVEPLWY